MNGNSAALDTNIAVAINNNDQAVVAWAQTLSAAYLPVPVLAELLFGAANSRNAQDNRDRVELLAARCALLVADAGTAKAYSKLRLQLKNLGRPVPENDLWIASICVQHAVPLCTLDGHFTDVPGLVVVRP